ncbi:MAG: MarR family transcriptional regulator [Novosphingobium sp. 28-62-57]|uniref:MarR family winged helix-turn-helix transcriptional regulator n=1 Tax=unclassified Novosphingobium TaxID=2644732 RepID=UPI000BD0DB04|nr:MULTISPECIES: MarR family winged helix-turn-helix transcriptional regulator [unclassified Novosphingobium]OYW50784.1 MAG: MarR family transcriptional regulator [Novosphingobium sp. 12-62-10]OYZ10078.1 MAG: MarR family transcriptional regulator [Novosphingobium sp. 28-62-57]OZA32742.1 MAG: MarR family transcriptional regulator [Novosphingobium sp. 17-62-9]HQS70477.1 MarR family winged helix-turn-helix transcriptional regulator [Novosphingobium sp.]
MSGTETRLTDFLPYRMAITSNAVSGLIAGEYRSEFGLKIPEWRIMAVLGEVGPLTQRDLVHATLMDKVAVNRACKVLEEKGFLQRSPNAEDGRSHHLELTVAGHELHAAIWPQAVEMYEKIFSSITTREQDKLRSILDKLLKAARALESDGK